MSSCLHCHAETSNGLALCELSQYEAKLALDVIPVYFRNLARNRRPGRPNGTLGAANQWLIQRGETESSRIAPALGHALTDLVTWAEALADDRGVKLPDCDDETATVIAVCKLLADHLTSIATLEWAGEFVRMLVRHDARLRALTETNVPGWYAGRCSRKVAMATEGDDGLCGADTYVVPGLTWVKCHGCGSTTYARDHLEAVIEEARMWLAPPKRLAEALVALLDSEPSVPRLYDRIRQWAKREEIAGVFRTTRDHVWSDEAQRLVVADVATGSARYRLGDVLDLMRRRESSIQQQSESA